MKKKISKILGVGLSLAMLASLMVMAAPTAASTLSFGSDSRPKTDNVVLGPAGVYVVDMAVNGDTIYAVTKDTAGDNKTYKSVDGGAKWTELTKKSDGALIAVSPDDANVIVMVTAQDNKIWYSTGGGSSFSELDQSTAMTGDAFTINDIDVSPAVSGSRYVAVVGSQSSVAKMYVLKLAMLQSWNERAGGTGFDAASDLNAVMFSPNYATDKIILTVTENTTVAALQIYWDESKAWNDDITGYIDYTPDRLKILTLSSETIAKASIAVPSTYLGIDEAERLVFIGLATSSSNGGAYRFVDNYLKGFGTWTGGAENPIGSIAYHDSGKILAGSWTNNLVYANDSPSASTPKFAKTNTLKQPAGADKTLVAWSGDTAVATTQGDESEFAVSSDDGYAFNGISLIDTVTSGGDVIDFAVAADASAKYMTSQDGTDASVWAYDGSTWYRVLSLATTDNLIVRVAPEDPSTIYVGEADTTDMWVSKDMGMTLWKHIPVYKLNSSNLLVDFVVESASVVYAIDDDSATKTTNSGASWGSAKALDTVTAASMITLAPNGDVLVGGLIGTAGYIAFSTDSGSTYDKTGTVGGTASAKVHVVADDGYADNSIIYAGQGLVVKRGKAVEAATWSTRSPSVNAGHAITGILQHENVTYVLAANATGGELFRSLKLETAASGKAEWSSKTTSYALNATPRAMTLTAGSVKIYAVDTTGDTPRSFTDPIATAGPTLNAPAEAFSVAVNPGTGQAYNITFSFDRYSSTSITDVDIQIATNDSFEGIVWSIYSMDITDIPGDTIVKVIGPSQSSPLQADFMPGTTYYWRVRVSSDGPMYSPWTESRSFIVGSPIAFAIDGPAIGSVDVSTNPTLVWSAFEGALFYELVVSTDPTFTLVDRNATTANSFYMIEQTLVEETTYYWRVRGITRESYTSANGRTRYPAQGSDWLVGQFTTAGAAAAAAGPTEPTVIVEYEPAAPPVVEIVEVPVSTPAPIPTYMLWIIIVIGAILFVALIVLIVRTRRVA